MYQIATSELWTKRYQKIFTWGKRWNQKKEEDANSHSGTSSFLKPLVLNIWGKIQFIPENLFPAICLVSSNTWPHWHDRQDSVFWGKEINIAFTHAIVNNVTHFRDCHPDVHANWNQDAWTEMNCTPDKISSYNFLSRLQLVITSFLPENYNENNNNNGNNNKYNNNYNYKFTETTRLLNQEIIIILVLKVQDWTKC